MITQRLILAPMEGVIDFALRQLLTAINPFDYGVTEFVRVVDARLPEKTFYRLAPELMQHGKTTSGTPIRVQLLGQHPDWLAENAHRAIELGSFGIDLNMGCPAKTVVGHQGGAYLLKNPEHIYTITKRVRKALPTPCTLSVKMRLGWETSDRCLEIADAITQGGANEIVVHGRTKNDGYRADKIDWHAIAKINQSTPLPVIANGDIFQPDDARQCQHITGCHDLMIGRGNLNQVNLASMIKHQSAPFSWQQTVAVILQYIDLHYGQPDQFITARVKQWLRYLMATYPEANTIFPTIRTLHSCSELRQHLQNR